MEIARCPHCGGEGQIKTVHKPFTHGWVGCPECRCYIQWNHDSTPAVKTWNARCGDGKG